MSVRPCNALCSALTVYMPPNPPPTTRILLRAVLHIAAAPDTFAVTYSSTYIHTSLLTRQELHAACAPHGYSSRAYLPEMIRYGPHQRTECVGGVSAASSPRHTRGHRAPRRAATPRR